MVHLVIPTLLDMTSMTIRSVVLGWSELMWTRSVIISKTVK